MRRILTVAALVMVAGCGRAPDKAADNAAAPLATPSATPSIVPTPSEAQRAEARAFMAAHGTESKEATALFDAMSKGTESALTRGLALRPGADGGWAEGLDISAAKGLPKAPALALAYVDHGATLESICTSPFIEPEPGVELAYLKEAVAALKGPPAAGVAPARWEACRASLETVLKEVEAQ